ncbi:type II secretion system F family protein [Clostridium mediterraneense]|uniref:type II secretion system F family protein n=1 Tax=Clostridium mediterraneense TaxID=1805472 RepID=UPI0008365C41|nr:type II secretion system F family protein [Clostridium mediterraneense]
MPKFNYRAMSSVGEIKEYKNFEADSIEDVYAMLKSNNMMPLNVEENQQSAEIKFDFVSKVKLRDIAIFCRQFSTMLEAGVTINASVNMLAEQLPNKKLKIVLSVIDEDIKKGEALSVAMGKHEDYFPSLLISMVEVGEMSGTLDSIMARMAVYYEKQHKLNGKIKNAMIYPVILSLVTVAVMTIILVFVMPMFIEMFESSGAELPWTTKLTLAISDFLRERWYIVIALVAAISSGFWFYTTKVESGIRNYNIYKLRYSPFKELNQKVVVSRFTRSLATVLSAGVTVINALEVVGGVLGNKFAENEIKSVKERVLKGEGLAQPIKDTGVFPLMLSSMVKIGEESGSLDDILSKTADFYDDELDRAIEAITSIIEPIMLVVMGIIVGFLIISVLTPMFEMYHTIA